MGLRGRRPTPTAILAKRGSWRAQHRVSHGEPQPEQRTPSCPAYLTKAEKQAWRQVAKELNAMRVITVADRNPLARYCVLFVRWRKACDFLEKYGTTQPVKDGNGTVKMFMNFPQVAEVNKLSVLLLKLEQEFGLTPAARTRITVDLPEKQSDDKSVFFAKTG